MLGVFACWQWSANGFNNSIPSLLANHACFSTTRNYGVAVSKETMRNARAWPQQCWKSCANGSNIVALRFGDHGIKEMLGSFWLKSLIGFKLCTRIPNNTQQHATGCSNERNNEGNELLANNFASVCTEL